MTEDSVSQSVVPGMPGSPPDGGDHARRHRQRRRFHADLKRYGPASQHRPGLREARAYCRRLARTHYENFTVVGLLVPGYLRQHFCNIYAWCRWADDLADECDVPEESRRLLAWWQSELEACYGGRPSHPVTVALAETVAECKIPRDPFWDLLVAFRQDQRQTRYDTFEQLLDYCRHSANPVGRLVLYVGRCFTAERAQLADSICTGLQLVNFWQDLAGDYARGRIYIPQTTLQRFGYDEAMFQRGEVNDAFRLMMKSLVDEAAAFLHRGLPLVAALPRHLQLSVALFARGGLAICDALAAVDYDVWHQRPQLARSKKLLLAAQTWWDWRRGYLAEELSP